MKYRTKLAGDGEDKDVFAGVASNGAVPEGIAVFDDRNGSDDFSGPDDPDDTESDWDLDNVEDAGDADNTRIAGAVDVKYMKCFICDDNGGGGRLDSWLTARDSDFTRSRIQNLIEEGLVLVNGNLSDKKSKVKQGDRVTVQIPEPTILEAVAEDIPLTVCYEDDDIIVVNKPRGMVVHPAQGNYTGTLVNALLSHCAGNLSDINGVIRPGIVHRLDKDTSGLIVAAKNNDAHVKLSEEFQHRRVRKIYNAVVVGGDLPERGRIDLPIGRHPTDRKRMAVRESGGRDSISLFRVVDRFDGTFTWLEVEILTGRTHQIRVHTAYIGHPVLGDAVYGKPLKKSVADLDAETQILHATQLHLTHPRTGETMVFQSPLPEYFIRVVEQLRQR